MRVFALTAWLFPLGAAFGDASAHGLAAPESHGLGSPVTGPWADIARPTPLSPDEEAGPAAAALARRFNPAMAFAHDDIWPVAVRYAWHDGSPLVGRVLSPDGRLRREFVALSHERLDAGDYGDLAATDADGNRIHYYIDGPGDDRIENGLSGWRRRWRAIQGEGKATGKAPYRPHQYAHAFWWNRDRGLLAVQYWFFYPYNEWINHHEGDWEHINVILRGPSRLDDDDGGRFRPVGYQFFFHEFAFEPQKVIRVGGADPREDHVVIYVGGQSHFYGWTGVQSGGSYPLPALFPRVGGGFARFRAPDDVRRPVRFIRPGDFTVALLPEPDRLDVGLHPELSWLRVSFFAGQAHMHGNPLTLNNASFGGPPRQPARQETWNADWHPPLWTGEPVFDPLAIALPRDWKSLLTPPRGAEAQLSARRKPRSLAAVETTRR